MENVNRDGICDGVMEDEVWGQREEAQTFMPLDTSQYGVQRAGTKCTGSKALHFRLQVREIRDRVCTSFARHPSSHTNLRESSIYQLRSRVEHISLPGYRD